MRIPGISDIAEKLAPKQVSVVIPSYNEAKTVNYVIDEALKLRAVGEVILVDDGSTDNTEKKIAPLKTNPRFIYVRHPKNRGKGAALKTGITRAKNEVILLLDADLMNITSAKIKKIFMPVIRDEVDVSRASFTLERGRVTEIAVKPMMKILFPDVDLKQPITGQVCAKKSFLTAVNLENRWGVDIGILLDAIQAGQRIIEINIGKLEHKARTDTDKAEMAQHVLETMIQKAGLIQHKYKLIVFTFDHTLIQKKTLDWIYERLAISSQISKLQKNFSGEALNYIEYAKEVAKLFQGKLISDVNEVCMAAPLVPYATELVAALKKRKYQVAMISSNFSPIVRPVCKTIGIEMIDCIYFEEKNGRYTGKITAASLEKWTAENIETAFNKAFVRITSRAKVKALETVMVANTPAWAPILAKVGLSIAYRPDNSILKEKANKTINVLAEILALIE